jgi:N-acetylneuraminate synthase
MIKSNGMPYFIADIGANHDGSITRAKDLIWLAKECGADSVKFQHFEAEKIVNDLEFNRLNDTSTHQSTWKKSVSEIYDEYHFKREWTDEVYKECVVADIEFSSTPYDEDAIELLKGIVPFIKIGSGDISWLSHIEKCIATGLPIIIASGASSMDDVHRAMSLFSEAPDKVCLMQCNTNYTVDPDKYKYVNLNVLKHYQRIFPSAILGLSDHTMTDTSVLGAIALGAKVIEKHFTDNTSREGPDHKFAIDPVNWRAMVDRSYQMTDILGDGFKRVEDNEVDAFVVQRRSCIANRNLEKGKVITENDLDFLRPCPVGSFHPYEAKLIVGKVLGKDMKKNEIFQADNLKEGL